MYTPTDKHEPLIALGDRLPRATEAAPQPAPMTLVNAKEGIYADAEGKMQTMRPMPSPRRFTATTFRTAEELKAWGYSAGPPTEQELATMKALDDAFRKETGAQLSGGWRRNRPGGSPVEQHSGERVNLITGGTIGRMQHAMADQSGAWGHGTPQQYGVFGLQKFEFPEHAGPDRSTLFKALARNLTEVFFKDWTQPTEAARPPGQPTPFYAKFDRVEFIRDPAKSTCPDHSAREQTP